MDGEFCLGVAWHNPYGSPSMIEEWSRFFAEPVWKATHCFAAMAFSNSKLLPQ
jgi:hypothetical protein